MRNYLIVVEGAHDIAVIEKLLKINGVNQKVSSIEELPKVWKRTIPSVFPFEQGKLDRITPIPSFVKNEDLSVAIKKAGGDKEIMNVLQQTLDTMLYEEIDQLDAIMLICDADAKTADEKRAEMLENHKEKDDFILQVKDDGISLDLKVKTVPVYTYVFPDDVESGNLENLLLETAKVVYPGLLNLAEQYVEQASEYQEILKKEQYAKKAEVGCIANAMKPGKANQVSIADDEWISETTLQNCIMLQNLNRVLLQMIDVAGYHIGIK